MRPARRWTDVLALVAGAIFSLAYAWTAIGLSRGTPPSTDEVFVVWTLRYIPFRELSAALAAGVDSLPLGYYALLEPTSSLFTIRLVSAGAFFAALAGVFVLLRRSVPDSAAMFGAMLVAATGAPVAAFLGRPYAIVTAAFAWALVSWSDAGSRPRRRRAVFLWLTLTIAVAMHFYAVLAALSIGAVECVRSIRLREWRPAFWVAMAGSAVALLASYDVIAPIFAWTHASSRAAGYYAKPSLELLLVDVQNLFVTGRMVVIALAAVIFALAYRIWTGRSATSTAPQTSLDVDLAAAAALLLPFVTFAFARLVTGVLNERYFYAATIGAGLLGARAIARRPAFLAVLLTAVLAVLQIRSAVVVSRWSPEPPPVSRATEPWPIVVPEASVFFPLVESAPAGLRDRLTYIGMPAPLSNPDPEPQRIAFAWKKYRPELAVFDAGDWLSTHRRFYVFCTQSAREGLTSWLIQRAAVRVVDRSQETWLLEVQLP